MTSRRIASARAAAADSGILVFVHGFVRAAVQALLAHQPADALTGASAALVTQLGMDPITPRKQQRRSSSHCYR